jgi:hypothetical protein
LSETDEELQISSLAFNRWTIETSNKPLIN